MNETLRSWLFRALGLAVGLVLIGYAVAMSLARAFNPSVLGAGFLGAAFIVYSLFSSKRSSSPADPRLVARVAHMLNSVARGELEAAAALRELEAREKEVAKSRQLTAAWALIQHFGDDADLRQRDPSYDHSMREDMKRHAKQMVEAG